MGGWRTRCGLQVRCQVPRPACPIGKSSEAVPSVVASPPPHSNPRLRPQMDVFTRRFGRNPLLDSLSWSSQLWGEANLHMVTTRAAGNLDGVQAGLARILTILTILRERFCSICWCIIFSRPSSKSHKGIPHELHCQLRRFL